MHVLFLLFFFLPITIPNCPCTCYRGRFLRALTVRDYLIKCQTMAMFASIRDIKDKEVWQLRKLRAMGINGLSIGVETK